LIVLLLHLATEKVLAWTWLAAASAAFGLALLVGHPQTALFIVYATEGYLVFRLIESRIAWNRALLAFVAYPAVSALVAAIQLLPSLVLLQLSTRDALDFASAASGCLVSALWQLQ